MIEIQLELNIENKDPKDFQLDCMQKQIDLMNESMGKVRKKLFSEISEMKKLYLNLHKENEELKTIIRKINHEKTEWVYTQGDYLFDVREYQAAAS